jgi:ABC-type branched-subunit amino acid transport system substrate-binding protein
MGRHSFVLALLAGALAACSASFSPKTCTVDSDCGDNAVCDVRGSDTLCVDAASAPILLGQSAPFSGVNASLGTDMNNGIQLAISEQNAKGGIRGRMLSINALDDGYDPIQAQTNAMMLTDAIDTGEMPTNCPNTGSAVSNGATPTPMLIPVSVTALDRGSDGVLALVGSVGTPTAVRATPVATETHTLFYGAFTGAGTPLRDETAGPCQKYVFNVRASYAQEAMATVEYFMNNSVNVTTTTNIISFDQNDTFGNAGYNGLVAAWQAVNMTTTTPTFQRFRYTRNDNTSVPTQAAAAEAYLATIVPTSGTLDVGVLMTDVYSSGSQFIQLIRQWQYGSGGPADKLRFHFSNISFVDGNALASDLKNAGTYTSPSGQEPYTTGVLVSNVVPNYLTNTAEIVTNYVKLAQAAGQPPGFTALEGYLSTNIFIQGLLNTAGPITPDTMIPALENLPNLSLGLGATAGFSSTNHQYLDSVWGTTLNADGTFADTYYWTVDTSSAPLGTFMSF